MKKIIILLTTVSIILLCSCGNAAPDKDGDKGDKGTETSSEQTASQTTVPESEIIISLENRISELEEKILKMESFFNLEYKDGEYGFINGRSPFSDDDSEEPHEEYDDTAVVNAYLSGDPSSLEGKDKEVFDLASAIISEIIKDGMSDYEKEFAVCSWITNNIEYDSEELAAIPAASVYSHLPYGALKYHRAICVGYATTFRLFMNMLKIENRLVHMTDSGEHAWNLVKLGDGWYHVDTTFNTTDDSGVPYGYFNITDEAISNDGYYENDGSLPEANAVEYNYYYINGTKMKVSELQSFVKQWLADGAKGSPGIILEGRISDTKIESVLDSLSDSFAEGYGIVTSYPCRADGVTVFGMRYLPADEDESDIDYDDDDYDDDDYDDDEYDDDGDGGVLIEEE